MIHWGFRSRLWKIYHHDHHPIWCALHFSNYPWTLVFPSYKERWTIDEASLIQIQISYFILQLTCYLFNLSKRLIMWDFKSEICAHGIEMHSNFPDPFETKVVSSTTQSSPCNCWCKVRCLAIEPVCIFKLRRNLIKKF